MAEKFRKKPVEIEAMQVSGADKDHRLCGPCAAVAWIGANGGESTCDGISLYIRMLESVMRADVGDWVIRGVKGEFYPCKPDIFAATYEPVEDGGSNG